MDYPATWTQYERAASLQVASPILGAIRHPSRQSGWSVWGMTTELEGFELEVDVSVTSSVTRVAVAEVDMVYIREKK